MPKSPKRSKKSLKPFWLEGKLYKRSKEKGPYFPDYVKYNRERQGGDPNFDCLSNYMCPPIKEVSRSRTPSPKTLRCEAEKSKRCKGTWTEKCYCRRKVAKKKVKSKESSSSEGSGSSSSSSEGSSSDSD
jgi:hypothetical protein